MRRIVIMGASSGIGYRCAEELASRGIRVGVAARNEAPLKKLKEQYPVMVEYAAIDITSPDAKSRLLRLIDRLGGMDIYFHVAGIGYENIDLDPATEVKIFETNTVGFVRCIATAWQYFRRNGIKGQIAAITSVAGTNGIGHIAAYSASKAADQKWLTAIDQLSHATHAGISITDIRPGWISTSLLDDGVCFPMQMQLDYSVPRVLKAIIRKKRVAVIDWRWNILVGLWRLLPNCIYTRLDVRRAGTLPKVKIPQ